MPVGNRKREKKFREPEDGLVIATFPERVVATERTSCAHCEWCWVDPRTGRCLYAAGGGEFVFVKSEGD